MSILKVNTIQDKGGNNLLVSDGAGTLSSSLVTNSPAFLYKMSGNQTISHNTNTLVSFDTKVVDTDNAFDTSAKKFTVPSGKAGLYFFCFNVAYSNSNGNTTVRFNNLLRVNGTTTIYVGDWSQAQDANADPAIVLSGMVNLSAGDEVDVLVYQNKSSDATLQSARTYFCGMKIIGA